MSQLAIYLFGPPRLELNETPVHIPRRKAMATLAYLAVTGQRHSRDTLAALFWPERPEQRTSRTTPDSLRNQPHLGDRLVGDRS
jgi:DNA-binding SARP family transcriptional activator